jgi:hypothetical protein
MMIRTLVLFSLCILFATVRLSAQTDTVTASQRALLLADNMLRAFKYSDWDQYVSLSYPGVVKYYGGKTGYLEHVRRTRTHYSDSLNQNPEKVRIVQISNDMNEWQCVMEKSRLTYAGGKRIRVISYLVGQSKDDGVNWKFFDVAYNSVENVIYIMPEIFDTLAIPVRRTVAEEEGIVQGGK